MLICILLFALCIKYPLALGIIRILPPKENLPFPLVTYPTGSKKIGVLVNISYCGFFKRYFCVHEEFLENTHFDFLFNLFTNIT